MKKRIVSAILTAAMAASLIVGCGSTAPAETQPETKTEETTEAQPEEKTEEKAEETTQAGGGKVGVAMPTKDLQRR